MVEPAVLALEGRYESFSLGPEPISLKKVEEIDAAARRHGFGTDHFAHGNRLYDNRQLDLIAARYGEERSASVPAPRAS